MGDAKAQDKQTPPDQAADTLLRNPFTREFWLGEVDLRPLALMRILLGLITLWDLFRRAEELVAWHTDLGVLPRAALVDGIARPWRLSLLDMMGTPGMVGTFFALAAVAAVCLTAGYKTRLANLLTWMAVVSLQERNLGVTDSSDTLFRVLLFWMMFAPAGAAYSLDRALLEKGDSREDPPDSARWPPMGSAVGFRFMQMEIVILYFVTCVTKNGDHWRDGSALYRALQVWDFARPTAQFYVDNLGFLSRPMSYTALLVEFSIATLLWFPSLKVRRILLLVGTGFHLSIESLFNVGMFSFMMPMTYALFLWPGAMDFVDRKMPSFPAVVRVARRWGLDRLLHQPRAWVDRPINRRVFVGLSVLMATIVWDQGHEMNNRFPRPPEPFVAVMESLSLWQNWRMFAPNPVFDSGPWVGEGYLTDGTPVDPLPVTVPGFAQPPPGRHYYSRWNKYRLHIRSPDQKGYLLWLGRHICRQWGLQRPHSPPLDKFKLVYQMKRSNAPWDPPNPVQPMVMWRHYCLQVPEREDNSW